MGASTVWQALPARPGWFAAAVPSPACRMPHRRPARAATPLWIVHGNRDETNPIRHDRASSCRSSTPAARCASGRSITWATVPPTWLLDGRLADFLLRPARP